jgi:site-specific DNA recombinase
MSAIQPRACGLVRVSSDEQVKGGYGLEFQEQDIRAFCERNGFELLKVFRDDGYSGASVNRPGFQGMMEWAREKRFDVVVVWKLDRLFRDTKLTLQTVDELAALGIEFRSVQETFTHDSNGRFLLTIFAAGAEKERKDISLRMSAGRVAAAKRGTWISGGGTPPYGYRYNPESKRLEIDEQEAPLVKQLFRWLIEDKWSLYKIQLRVNELRVPTKLDRLGRKKMTGSSCWWGKRTIGRILANEVYTGSFTFRKYRRLGSVRGERNLRPKEDWVTVTGPAIISQEKFDKAQEQLRRNAVNSPRRTKELYLLQKLLICGHDGRRMQAATRPADRGRECKYYFCSGTRKTFAAVRCPSHTVSESRIGPPVWEKIEQLLQNPSVTLKSLAEYQRNKAKIRDVAQEKRALETRRERGAERSKRLAELYLGQAIEREHFQAERRRLKDEADEIGRELAKLQKVVTTQEEILASALSLQEVYGKYESRLKSPSNAVKQTILRKFVKNIVVRGEDLELEVKLPPPDAVCGTAASAAVPQRDFSIFLTTRLLSISQVWKDRELHRNLGPFAIRHSQKRGDVAA